MISVPLALVIVVFSLTNRHAVTVDFWPFPLTLDIPLFVVILATLIVGVLWGGLAAWRAARQVRRRAREMSRRAEATEMEIRHLEEHNSRLQRDLNIARSEVSGADKKLLPPADAA